jgi:hypothetical protein
MGIKITSCTGKQFGFYAAVSQITVWCKMNFNDMFIGLSKVPLIFSLQVDHLKQARKMILMNLKNLKQTKMIVNG